MARSSASRVASDTRFEARLGELRRPAAPAPDAAVLEQMVASVVSSLSGGVSLADLQLYREVETLAEYIQTARREIAGVRPDDIRERHIPMATDELDAVVSATAEATGIILGAMEEFERMAAELPPKQAKQIADAVVRVYEACSFQDITGQRITKVVRALKHIEGKIDALLAVFGADLVGAAPAEAEAADDKLLNGPALPSAATNSQADIDAILASFD
ncbi:MAG TPA: protein phosphatase CheZ [Stellaceae bacterium]|nr:protein phosphatase CheZ [Stellaceae bacterium]